MNFALLKKQANPKTQEKKSVNKEKKMGVEQKEHISVISQQRLVGVL